MPVSSLQVSWVVPCFNEAGARADGLRRNVGELDTALAALGLPYAVLWVDDGSRDDTCATLDGALARYPAHRLLRQPANRGKGAALKAGFAAARGRWIGFCDADLAVDLALLPVLVGRLREGCEVAIASKWQDGASTAYSPRRRVLSGTYRWAARRLARVDVVDFQCGMKAFDAAACQAVLVQCRQDGWLWDTEALARLGRRGARIAELPAVIRHGEPGRPSRLLVWRSVRDLAFDYFRLWRDLRQ